MRSEEEIVEKFHVLYGKALRERRENYLSTNYINCQYNVRRRVPKFGRIGFCSNPDVLEESRSGVFVCNDRDCAKGCNHFSCKNTEKSVRKDLENVMTNPTLCGQEYPKLAVILWFLQKSGSEPKRSGRFLSAVNGALQSVFDLVLFRWW